MSLLDRGGECGKGRGRSRFSCQLMLAMYNKVNGQFLAVYAPWHVSLHASCCPGLALAYRVGAAAAEGAQPALAAPCHISPANLAEVT